MQDAKYEKFIIAMQLMDVCVGLTKEYWAADVHKDTVDQNASRKEKLTVVLESWDELYSFIYANFDAPQSAMKEGGFWSDVITMFSEDVALQQEAHMCYEMLMMPREELLIKIKKIPPAFAEVLFPVAVARHLLCAAQVPAIPSRLVTFDEFHRRYGPMICLPFWKKAK